MKSVTLSKETIDAIFAAQPTDQGEFLVALYRAVLPQWDRIETLDGWPTCNKRTWKYICTLFMEFDRHHAPQCLAGGAWMNSGFSTLEGEGLADWKVLPCQYTLKAEEVAA